MTEQDPTGAVIAEVEAERRRQQDDEGFTRDRDEACHDIGDLSFHAALYAAEPDDPNDQDRLWAVAIGLHISFDPDRSNFGQHINIEDPWCWDHEFDKRRKHDRRRRLVIAAALIVAEIELIDRAAEMKNL